MNDVNGEKCLVTGGTGFLGRYVTRSLIARGYDVTVLSRHPGEGPHIVGDLGTNDLNLGDRSFSTVYHLAALAHRVPRDDAERAMFFRVNARGTENLLHALERLPRFPSAIVLASSVAVYGRDEGMLLDESTPCDATSPYGLSKRQAEDAVLQWCDKHGVRSGIVRLPVIVGARPPGNMGAWARAISRRRYLGVGCGSARRSMVLASDVAAVLHNIAAVGGVFHLTDGHHPALVELEQAFYAVLHRRPPPRLPLCLAKPAARVGDVLQTVLKREAPFNSRKLKTMTSTLTFSDQRARQLLPWNPARVVDHLAELNGC